MAQEKRKAFTLVELLVVIVIIGMLMALLLPAVLGARQRAQQTQCTNYQQELGKAILQYETAKGYLPGYVNNLGANLADDNGDGVVDDRDETGVSWVVMVLQYLGEGDLWKKWRDPNVPLHEKVDPANANFAAVKLPRVICPTDDPMEELAPLSYVVNTGLSDLTADVQNLASNLYGGDTARAMRVVTDPAVGLFFDHWVPPQQRTRVSIDKITDGTGNTIMISENTSATQWAPVDLTAPAPYPPRWPNQLDVGMVWWSELVPPGPVTSGDGRKINDDPDTAPPNQRFLARPSSGHAGGAVVTFADGHTAFQSEDIDYDVYQSLMTPEVSKAKKSGLIAP